jgi:hypothetical protein
MSAQQAAASGEPAPPHVPARTPAARYARPAPPAAAPAAAPPPSQAVPLVAAAGAAAALLQPPLSGAAEGPHAAVPDGSAAPAAPASGEGAAAVPQALNGAAAWAALRGLQTACADGQDGNPYSLLCSLVRPGRAAPRLRLQ